MGSAVSSCFEPSIADATTTSSNNNNNSNNSNPNKPGDEVSDDPALRAMLERFQRADKAVTMNNYPLAVQIITEAEEYLTKLSQKHLSEAHLHAMAIFQRRGTYRRMMNQLKEAIEEYEFGLEIGEAKVQKRGTASQYLLLHLMCETSCLMASCHMGLLIGCKRVLALRKARQAKQAEQLGATAAAAGGPPSGDDLMSNQQFGNIAQQMNHNNNNTNMGSAGTDREHHQQQQQQQYSRPPSQLATLHDTNNNVAASYHHNNNNNNNTNLIGVGSHAGAVSFGGRMTPPGENSNDNSKDTARQAMRRGHQHSSATDANGFLTVPGSTPQNQQSSLGGDLLSSRSKRSKRQIVTFKVEDEEMLGAGPESFSFAASIAQNMSLINDENDGGEMFEALAYEDPVMGPLMGLPDAVLEIQENLHSKSAEQVLLKCIDHVEELQNRQSELLLGPLFRLADLYETLEMLQPCERCVRRLVGISLVKYGHDHEVYIRQHYRLTQIAAQKEERKTLKAAVMIVKTWKMKVQMKRLRAANARQSFEPRRHTKLERDAPPPDEKSAQEILKKIVGLQEDPPSEYDESEEENIDFDEDYENYNDDDLVVVPGWGDDKDGKKKPKKEEKSDDPFKALKDAVSGGR